MSEWKQTKLINLCHFQRGHDLSKTEMSGGVYPVAGSNSIIGYHDKYTTKGPSLTIGRSGNIGTPYFYKSDFWAHNTVLYVKNFYGNDPKFAYYFLKNIDFTQYNVGSAVPTLNRNHIHEYEIMLPSLPEQESIAEVLSSLDDKINLLQEQNKTLEALAETLFRQWFVESEQNAETVTLSIEDVAVVQNGYSFKSSEFTSEANDTIEVLKMGHISADGGLRSSPKKDFVKREEKYSKWILNKRDIILAMTDMKDNVVILGVPALIDKSDKYVLNQRVCRIYLKDRSPISNILILYMQMKDKTFISELQSKGNSGVQVNLGTDTIRQTKVVVPSKALQEGIIFSLDSLFSKLESNRVNIHHLESIRDTLLPKLMSGAVRVN